MSSKDIRIGILGMGQWGRNYLRLFSQLEGARIVRCCDTSARQLEKLKRHIPTRVVVGTDPRAVLKDSGVDAVILTVPTSLHYDLASRALQAGKHVLVEKPMALNLDQAERLARLSRLRRRTLMVGHTFLYHPVVRKMKEHIQDMSLGRLHYFHSLRTNLGPIRSDVNALLDLAPHDISIVLYLLDQVPTAAQAVGAVFINKGLEDAVSATLHFPGGIKAFLHVSWLEPMKVRRMTVVGERRMMIFDDMDLAEPLRVYDKYVPIPRSYEDFAEFRTIVHEGDVHVPHISLEEPLRNQSQAFLESVRSGEAGLSGPDFSLRVMQVLEACQRSLRRRGALVKIR